MNPNQVEISLLGTGGGYGECIVSHVGNNEWIVIDSCKNPNTGESLPLEFLRENNIDLDNVKLVICTHWHDDHIQGISDIYESAKNSMLCYARAHDQKKFLRFVSSDQKKAEYSVSNSSTTEFNNCLDIAIERNSGIIKYAEPDRLLYTSNAEGQPINIYSLSPSDLSNQLFDQEVSRLIDQFGKRNKKLPYQKPNHRSVVILIQSGFHSILLGSDLEINDNPNLGWENIISNSQVVKITNNSSYFKIPHHGSRNGYHEGIWSEILNKNPTASITPWNKNTKLPETEMIELYRELSNNLFMTSPVYNRSNPKKRDNRIEKIISSFNDSIQELRFDYGKVCSRINLNDPSDEWKIDCYGSAFNC